MLHYCNKIRFLCIILAFGITKVLILVLIVESISLSNFPELMKEKLPQQYIALITRPRALSFFRENNVLWISSSVTSICNLLLFVILLIMMDSFRLDYDPKSLIIIKTKGDKWEWSFILLSVNKPAQWILGLIRKF